ncbi:MAG: CPBP family intramembrane glutamic endopeptidase [Nocardioides sp.]
MTSPRSRGLAIAVGVHVARFAVIIGGLTLGPLLGITGWYTGLFVNVLCAAFAAALVTCCGLWRRIGFTTLWRGRTAALLLLVPLGEALVWLLPDGLVEQPPGFGLWALTLLLVGFNEELVSRGVVLERLRRGFGPTSAVVLTAALFGLQHLSAFATTSRGSYDILTNVLVSGCYGFALAAFQLRFAWIWPLILIHGLADFTTILTSGGLSDALVVVTLVVFIGYGVLLLRGRIGLMREARSHTRTS